MQFAPSGIMRYRDFVLEIRSEERGVIRARVAASPAGDTGEFLLRLSISPAEIDDALASITYSSGNFLKRSNLSANYDPVIRIGERLFHDLLHESMISRLFRQAQDMVQSRGEGLRLRFAAHDLEALALPWEFLFDGAQSSFLALSLRTPIVRWLMREPPVVLRPVAPPLRILVVTAEVMDFEAQAEIEILHELASRTGMFDVQVVEDATFPDLREALRTQPCHILHFIGTGAYGSGRGRWSKVRPDDGIGPNQGLLLMGEHSRRKDKLEDAEFVPATELRNLIETSAELRFVVLQACDSEAVAAELAQRTPAALGVRAKVLNATCQAMARGLYEALAGGQPLEAAVTAGRQAIDRQHAGTREWGLPTFYMSAPHGILLGPGTKGVLSSVLESATLESSGSLALSTPTATANQREVQRLQSLLEIESRNLDSLREQQAFLGSSTPEFILSQIAAAEQTIADLEAQLQALQ
ncbi:MAG: hypothetical protein DCC55_13425 [Chloroflexi bacterium]|nr:MAG: hypothetical protein DCC55_13425 [Chloroflexota bacterium]